MAGANAGPSPSAPKDDDNNSNDGGPRVAWGMAELTQLVTAVDDLAQLHRQSFDEIRSDQLRLMNNTNQCEAQVQSCRLVGQFGICSWSIVCFVSGEPGNFQDCVELHCGAHCYWLIKLIRSSSE